MGIAPKQEEPIPPAPAQQGRLAKALYVTAYVLASLMIIASITSLVAGIVAGVLISPYMALICVIGIVLILGLTAASSLMHKFQQRELISHSRSQSISDPKEITTPDLPTETSEAMPTKQLEEATSAKHQALLDGVRADLEAELTTNFSRDKTLPTSISVSNLQAASIYTHNKLSGVHIISLKVEPSSMILKNLKPVPRLVLLPAEAKIEQLELPYTSAQLTSQFLDIDSPETWQKAIKRLSQQDKEVGGWSVSLPPNHAQIPLLTVWNPFSIYENIPPYDSPSTHPLRGPFSFEAMTQMFHSLFSSFLSTGINAVAIQVPSLINPTDIVNQPYNDPFDDAESESRVLLAMTSAVDQIAKERSSKGFELSILLYDYQTDVLASMLKK